MVTKSELPDAEQAYHEIVAAVEKEATLISAVTGDGVPELIRSIAAVLSEAEAKKISEPGKDSTGTASSTGTADTASSS